MLLIIVLNCWLLPVAPVRCAPSAVRITPTAPRSYSNAHFVVLLLRISPRIVVRAKIVLLGRSTLALCSSTRLLASRRRVLLAALLVASPLDSVRDVARASELPLLDRSRHGRSAVRAGQRKTRRGGRRGETKRVDLRAHELASNLTRRAKGLLDGGRGTGLVHAFDTSWASVGVAKLISVARLSSLAARVHSPAPDAGSGRDGGFPLGELHPAAVLGEDGCDEPAESARLWASRVRTGCRPSPSSSRASSPSSSPPRQSRPTCASSRTIALRGSAAVARGMETYRCSGAHRHQTRASSWTLLRQNSFLPASIGQG